MTMRLIVRKDSAWFPWTYRVLDGDRVIDVGIYAQHYMALEVGLYWLKQYSALKQFVVNGQGAS